MRFFSNDARDNSDDEVQADDRPDRVKSEPVAVPVQRPSSSPWAASPGTVPARDATPPADTADRADDSPGQASAGPGSGGRPVFHEPSAQPTAFGASTVGGAVAASALANPVNDGQHDPDRRTDAASGVADDDTVGPHDGVADDDADNDADDTRRRPDAAGQGAPPARAAGPRDDDLVDTSLQDGGTFSDPVVVEPGGRARSFAGTTPPPSGYAPAAVAVPLTGREHDDTPAGGTPVAGTPGAGGPAHGSGPAAAAGAAAGSAHGLPSAGHAPGSPREDQPAPDDGRDGSTQQSPGGGPTPQGQAGGLAPAGRLPGSEPPPEVGPLFADADAHSFRDRWRDVQLRFVDDPKAAADDAAALVDDAVDALAASLKTQREQLTGAATPDSGADTEQLRVRLRTYRDFLDRLLDL